MDVTIETNGENNHFNNTYFSEANLFSSPLSIQAEEENKPLTLPLWKNKKISTNRYLVRPTPPSIPPPPMIPPPPLLEDNLASTITRGKGSFLQLLHSIINLFTCGGMQLPDAQPPIFIPLISFVQIVVFIAMVCTKGIESAIINPMIGPDLDTLVSWGGKSAQKIGSQYHMFRFLSPCILHSGFIHLFFNMMWQLTLGVRCELYWGLWRTVGIYIMGGLGGNVLSCVMQPDLISVGASSCVSGLLGAMIADLALNWNNRAAIRYPFRSIFVLFVQMFLFILIGLVPLIDNFSHIGGLIIGFLTALVILPQQIETGYVFVLDTSQEKSEMGEETETLVSSEALRNNVVEHKADSNNNSIENEAGGPKPEDNRNSYDCDDSNPSHSTWTYKPGMRYSHLVKKLNTLYTSCRVISAVAILAYFALFLSLFFTIVAKHKWTCRACPYLNPSWEFFMQ